MASWLGKDTELIQGAADQAFKPSGAPAPLGTDPTQDCLNTCNDRYQKDLDNPSVDYMEAQRRYTDCKASCGDVGAIPTEITAMPPDGEPKPITPPGPPIGPEPSFCEGGYKLHTGPITDEDRHPGRGCGEGLEPRYDPATISTWCCPTTAPKCTEDRHCPEGQHCVNGRCVPIEEPVVDEDGEECTGGYILSSDPIAGGAGSIWTDETIKSEHKWFRDPLSEGHRIWHKDWGFQMLDDVYKYLQGTGTLTKSTAGACKKGFRQQDVNGEAWCCPSGDGDEAPPDGLGEYGIPDWLQELLDMLMGRGKELLDPSQYGYSQEAMDAMFGRGFEKVRGAGRATRETLSDVLSRSGMLGTGAETGLMGETAWATERGISDLQRDLMIKGEEQRKKDLLSYTGLAQDIFGGAGIGSEAFREMVNVGRRGERQSWYQMLLNFFQGLQ